MQDIVKKDLAEFIGDGMMAVTRQADKLHHPAPDLQFFLSVLMHEGLLTECEGWERKAFFVFMPGDAQAMLADITAAILADGAVNIPDVFYQLQAAADTLDAAEA